MITVLPACTLKHGISLIRAVCVKKENSLPWRVLEGFGGDD